MQILRCAQDDNPSSASFDSHNAFFEMYWSLSWSYERLSLPPGATQASPPHALIHPRPYGKTAVLRPLLDADGATTRELALLLAEAHRKIRSLIGGITSLSAP